MCLCVLDPRRASSGSGSADDIGEYGGGEGVAGSSSGAVLGGSAATAPWDLHEVRKRLMCRRMRIASLPQQRTSVTVAPCELHRVASARPTRGANVFELSPARALFGPVVAKVEGCHLERTRRIILIGQCLNDSER